MTVDPISGYEFPPEAIEVGNRAFREARDEGCKCKEPSIVLSPALWPPFWKAVVEHDEWCPVIVRLRRAGATTQDGTPL